MPQKIHTSCKGGNWIVEKLGRQYLNQAVKVYVTNHGQVQILCHWYNAVRRAQHDISVVFLRKKMHNLNTSLRQLKWAQIERYSAIKLAQSSHQGNSCRLKETKEMWQLFCVIADGILLHFGALLERVEKPELGLRILRADCKRMSLFIENTLITLRVIEYHVSKLLLTCWGKNVPCTIFATFL